MRRAMRLIVLIVFAATWIAAAEPELPADLADVPAVECRAGDNPRMSYLLLGPRARDKQPEDGYGLLVILRSEPAPDGDPGSAVLLRRIFKRGLPGRFVAAAPKPVRWTPDQRVLWPTAKVKVPEQEFSTEQFVKDVVQDVKGKHKINPVHTFVMGWGESGPTAMTVALEPDRPVTGAFIAMSDFSASALPPLKGAEGAAFFFYHSPDDEVVSFRKANMAKLLMAQQGAKTELKPYEGGHGWPEEFTTDVRSGIRWLQSAAVPPKEGAGGVSVADGPPPDAGQALLYDSFEQGRVTPDGWEERSSREFAGRHIWDREVAAVGDASVSLEGRSPLTASVGRWFRKLDIRKPTTGLLISVRVKAEGVVYARLLVECHAADGRGLNSTSAVEVGTLRGRGETVTHDWKEYDSKAIVPRGTAVVFLAFELHGPGRVWFDDLLVKD